MGEEEKVLTPIGPLLALFPAMTELEYELMKLMVKLVVRYPDGVERIEAAFVSVVQAGFELSEQEKLIDQTRYVGQTDIH